MNNQPLNKKIELSGYEQKMPGIPLVGRQGIPFLWNPFSSMLLPGSIRENDKDETISFNVCIAGCPESGKTTFIEQMIDTVVGVGGRVFVFDKGNSFKGICERIKGQHIELDTCLPISLNPFSNVSIDDECLHNNMMETIFAFFQVMAASNQGTSDLQNSYIYLQEAINYSWEKYKNKSSVDTVKEFLDQHEELAAKNIGQALYPFSGKGTYGQFFSKQANAVFKEKLTVIEMERLQDNQSLTTLIIYTFLIQIFQEMAKGDRVTPFLIIIEEPGQILDQKLSENLSDFQRSLRMKKGGIVWSTTDVNDFFNPEFPLACDVCGAAWKCIFEQPADVIDSLKRYPRLPSLIDNERKEALLYSLRSQLPEYSEVAIYDWNDNAVVGRLHLDSQGNPLYLPEPEDYWQMDKDTHIEDICEESSFQELKYSTNAPAYRLIEGKESEKEKQSHVNSHLPLPTKELSALGWIIIIGFMTLLLVTEVAQFTVSLPVATAHPVWKLLSLKGSSLLPAAVVGIALGILSQEERSQYLHLKKLKLFDRIFGFFIRGFVVLCLIVIAMKCSLTEFEQSAYFDWDKAEGWLCEGTLMLIINGIIWLIFLSLIAYVTSRPRFVAAIEQRLFKPSPVPVNSENRDLVIETIPLTSAPLKGEGE